VGRTRIQLGTREDLGADCASCFGLCCVALAFARSADFPIDKAAGDPCVHLDEADACRVHAQLRPRGFKGCTVFDCFGAGQKVSRQTLAGRSWRLDAETRTQMLQTFPVVRRLHELLWYLDQAIALTDDAAGAEALVARFEHVRALSDQGPDQLAVVDVDAEYDLARPLLLGASEAARSGHHAGPAGRLRPGSDLSGARLVHADLSGLTLRGALLIGADLSGARLSRCDLLGVDLRDANLAGADLAEAIYLTQMQVNSARGDAATLLPPGFERPSHWHA
jgi:uncharacterized protein YjbI with pentapeptide repeats